MDKNKLKLFFEWFYLNNSSSNQEKDCLNILSEQNYSTNFSGVLQKKEGAKICGKKFLT